MNRKGMHMKSLSTHNLVEAIGMLGIMGSLIFVGIEVSQNSSIARTASYQSYINGFTVLNLAQINSDKLNSLMVRASNGTSTNDFTPEEQRKLRLFYIALLRQWEGLYRSVNEGILPEEMLTIVGAGHLLGYRVFKEMWPDIRLLFTEDFSVFIDGIKSE
jgi:hypothetical protein